MNSGQGEAGIGVPVQCYTECNSIQLLTVLCTLQQYAHGHQQTLHDQETPSAPPGYWGSPVYYRHPCCRYCALLVTGALGCYSYTPSKWVNPQGTTRWAMPLIHGALAPLHALAELQRKSVTLHLRCLAEPPPSQMCTCAPPCKGSPGPHQASGVICCVAPMWYTKPPTPVRVLPEFSLLIPFIVLWPLSVSALAY